MVLRLMCLDRCTACWLGLRRSKQTGAGMIQKTVITSLILLVAFGAPGLAQTREQNPSQTGSEPTITLWVMPSEPADQRPTPPGITVDQEIDDFVRRFPHITILNISDPYLH